MTFLQIILILLVLFGVGLAVYFILRLTRRHAKRTDVQRGVVLRVLVPKNNEKTPLSAEQMFASLHGLFDPLRPAQARVSFEVAARQGYIQFYVWAPLEFKDFIEGQIYAQYPTAEMTIVEDYAAITLEEMLMSTDQGQPNTSRVAAGTELKLTKLDVYPIKTFPNFEVDPLSAITAALSKIEVGEDLWVQFVVRPVADDWYKKGIDHITFMRTGIRPGASRIQALLLFFANTLHGAFQATVPPPAVRETNGKKDKKDEQKEKKLPGPAEAALTGVEEKIAKLGFETIVRIVAIAPDAPSARAKLLGLVGAFKQFNSINMNGFSVGAITSGTEVLHAFALRQLAPVSPIFNIEELASMFHLPNISVETPAIVWSGSKKGEPPANLPLEGLLTEEGITYFGKTNFRNEQKKFGIKLRDRRYHMYAIGKTGTGKSTLLDNMILDDIAEGRGVAVVDPHGDLVAHVLKYVPPERYDDVVIFSPADANFPVGFNVLENVDPELKNIVASGVVGIFEKIFGEISWGPRLEYILRNTVLALLEYPDATMLGIIRILTNKVYRSKVLAQVEDPVIRAFFLDEFEKYDGKFRTEAIAPIQNKVGQFLSSSTIRNIVGQPKSTINIEEIMNSGKILLVDLSTGKIGEDNSALLGAMMITKIQLAAMRRANVPEEERRDFYLYVDEFQNFATSSFATILSEARKYHLNLIMTNQYIAQMPEPVRDAVFGNVGTLVTFRIGATDATAVVKEFAPVFEEIDLVNLDNYHVYVKMSIDGVTSQAFSALTLPPKKEAAADVTAIIERSRQRYGRPKEEVERQIQEMTNADSILPSGELAPANSNAQLKATKELTADVTEGPSGNIVIKAGKRFQIAKDKKDEEQRWYVGIDPSADEASPSASAAQTKVGDSPGEKQEQEQPITSGLLEKTVAHRVARNLDKEEVEKT